MRYLILATFLLSGCGRCQRAYTHYTGDFTYKCARSGVEYVQSDSGIALHVNREGKPVVCN
jgi:hypothetical protein